MNLIALYKAFTGGEWFESSMESVAPHVDGICVVFSRGPWLSALEIENSCIAPLERFRQRHPSMRIVDFDIQTSGQVRQYEAGIEMVRATWGEDARILVVDTDEIWPSDSLLRLRHAMQTESADYYLGGIRTYLRSPLYQVWPPEPSQVVVGLGNARPREVRGRFQFDPGRVKTLVLSDCIVHHFPYVRATDDAMHDKFLNTGAQEHVTSDYTWFDRVYNRLPYGHNLHMSAGYEKAWREIKVLHELPGCVMWSDFARLKVGQCAEQWRARLRATQPDHEDVLIPVPTARDAEVYAVELDALSGGEANELVSRLKCTVLEALHLGRFAAGVPSGGSILEVGSGSGGSMACLALGKPDAKLIAVDPFEPYDEQTHAGLARGVTEGNETEFWRTASEFGYGRRLRLYKQRSAEAADKIPDGSQDLVLVDGNHSEPIVREDLRLYWPKVRQGGTLLVHDYTTRFCGVIAAVDDWRPADHGWTPEGTSLLAVCRSEG